MKKFISYGKNVYDQTEINAVTATLRKSLRWVKQY